MDEKEDVRSASSTISRGSCAASWLLATMDSLAFPLVILSFSDLVLSRLIVLHLNRYESTSLAQLSSDPLVSEALVGFEQEVHHRTDLESRSHYDVYCNDGQHE